MRTVRAPVAALRRPSDPLAIEEIQRVVRALRAYGPLSGIDVEASLVAGSNTVAHTLGRTPVGWMIQDIETGAASVYRTAWDERTITLTSAGTTTLLLRIW